VSVLSDHIDWAVDQVFDDVREALRQDLRPVKIEAKSPVQAFELLALDLFTPEGT
jgi:hypothetical protein